MLLLFVLFSYTSVFWFILVVYWGDEIDICLLYIADSVIRVYYYINGFSVMDVSKVYY